MARPLLAHAPRYWSARSGTGQKSCGASPCRRVSAEEFAAWEPVYRAAKTALQDRDAGLDAAAELIEKDLLLLGATAIEDKLQEV